jgi:hypothetical protein
MRTGVIILLNLVLIFFNLSLAYSQEEKEIYVKGTSKNLLFLEVPL